MSSGDKVRLHICVERELYDRLYARHRDTGELMVSVLRRALEKELSTASGTNEPTIHK